MSTHAEMKEALESAANAALAQAGADWQIAFTRQGAWTVADDGTVTPPVFAATASKVAPPSSPPPPSPPPSPDGTTSPGALDVGQTFTKPEDA